MYNFSWFLLFATFACFCCKEERELLTRIKHERLKNYITQPVQNHKGRQQKEIVPKLIIERNKRKKEKEKINKKNEQLLQNRTFLQLEKLNEVRNLIRDFILNVTEAKEQRQLYSQAARDSNSTNDETVVKEWGTNSNNTNGNSPFLQIIEKNDTKLPESNISENNTNNNVTANNETINSNRISNKTVLDKGKTLQIHNQNNKTNVSEIINKGNVKIANDKQHQKVGKNQVMLNESKAQKINKTNGFDIQEIIDDEPEGGMIMLNSRMPKPSEIIKFVNSKSQVSPDVVDVFSDDNDDSVSAHAPNKQIIEEDRKDINRKKLYAIKNFLRNTKEDIHYRSYIPHAEKNMSSKRMFKHGKQKRGTGNVLNIFLRLK